jgi:hypothetical protein
MKHIEKIEAHSRRLPESLQKEVLDFVCFLEARYLGERGRQYTRRTPVSDREVERACGVLKATHGVTLEEMDAAIRKRGGEL